MVSGSDVAIAGVVGLLGAEAVGLTNFSGGGGEQPAAPQFPDTGLGAGEVLALLQAGQGAGETVTRVVETGGGGGEGIADALSQLVEATQQPPIIVPTGGNGAGPDTADTDPGGGTGGDTGPGAFGITARQRGAAQVGRDPFGLQALTGPGSRVGQAAEAARAAGEIPGGVAEFVGTPGGPGEATGVFSGISDAGQVTGEAISTGFDALTRDPTEDVFGGSLFGL